VARRSSERSPAKIKHAEHLALWALVEGAGAVADAFNCHPDYLTEKGNKSAVESVTKRVVGQIVGKVSEAQSAGLRAS
jgi:hypothetical protein